MKGCYFMSHIAKTRKIIHFGDSSLRTPCSSIEVFHKGLHTKIDILSRTLRNHDGGAALAAPQISLLKKIVVIDYLGEYFELVNPEVMDRSGELTDFEGCLSLPGFWGKVKRYERIKVRYQDRSGESHVIEIKNQMARCFQHEIDHLSGILYIDKMEDEYVFNDETKERISVKYLLELTSKRSSLSLS